MAALDVLLVRIDGEPPATSAWHALCDRAGPVSIALNDAPTSLRVHDATPGEPLAFGDDAQAHAPDANQLQALLDSGTLKRGRNKITYTLATAPPNAFDAWLHVVDAASPLVVFDIDGTVTSSDLAGHVGAVFNVAFIHPGVCEFACRLQSRGYEILFLTARGLVGPAGIERTRHFLFDVARDADSGFSMPLGPVITTAHTSTGAALYDEVIAHASGAFKEDKLRAIAGLYPRRPAGATAGLVGGLFAGFGNKKKDALAYVAASISPQHIYIIDTASRLLRWSMADESAGPPQEPGGRRSWKSYLGMMACVDDEFPLVRDELEAMQSFAQYAALAARSRGSASKGRSYTFGTAPKTSASASVTS